MVHTKWWIWYKSLHDTGYNFLFLVFFWKRKCIFFSKLESYFCISTFILVIYVHTGTHIHTCMQIQQHEVASDLFNSQPGHSVNLKGLEEGTWYRNVKFSIHGMVDWQSNESNLTFFLFLSLFRMNTECFQMFLLEHQMPGNAVVFCFHHFIYLLFHSTNGKQQLAPEKVLKHVESIGAMLINVNSLPKGIPPSSSVFKCVYLWKQTY